MYSDPDTPGGDPKTLKREPSEPATINKEPSTIRGEAHLDEPEPTGVLTDMQHAVREYLAFLIRTADSATVSAALTSGRAKAAPKSGPARFELFSLTDLFGSVGDGIHKGSIHALNVEDFGLVPVVSSSTARNGIMGYYDLGPERPRFRNVITVASNGTPLTSYYHPYEIVPKDDVFVCDPPDDFPLPSIFYTIIALNAITWRFSYYRKAYLNKLDKISIYMPVVADGGIDHGWIQKLISSCDGWVQLQAAMPTWQPQPFVSLGKRPTAQPLPSDDQPLGRDDRVKLDMDPEEALRTLLTTPPSRDDPE